ncbi:MAG: hypothetical protein NTV80_10340 [Verrucomicrobia bacterium]|nr:hypothetical protein [Verrucomicrobiota bacterium]
MRSPHFALCAIVMAVSGFWPGAAKAQSGKSEVYPYAFSTRTYSLPSNELVLGFVSKDKGKLRAPELPPLSASHGELETFLKRSHEVVKEYLAIHGVPLPPGSLACYDPASYTLSLRAMNAVQEMARSLSEARMNSATKHASWRLEVIEAASSDLRAMVAQCRGLVDHGKLLDAITAKGSVITLMRGETKGGQPIRTRQGSRFSRPTEYATDHSGHVESAVEDAFSGLMFELDPVIGENGHIDINCFFQYWPTPPKSRLATLTAGSAPKVEVEWLDVPAFTTKFSTQILSGQTRLIGLWDMDATLDPGKAGRSQAAFLCIHIVSLLPLSEPRLEAMLRERGEAVVPTPKGVRPIADPTLPPGMMVRRFRLPADFESMGDGGAAASASAADPFASGAAPVNEPRFVRSVTSEDILKSAGIPFPPGASANFLRSTGELVVRNLPENLELVQAFVDSIRERGTKLNHTTVEIIEADASLLRRLTREAESLPDHTAVQKALDVEIAAGKARVIRTVWFETKGGQPAKWENVIQTQTNPKLGVHSASPAPEPAKKDGAPAPAEAKADQKTGLHVSADTEAIGCQIEIDPIIGENSILDLNILVKADTAPAGTLDASAAPEPGIQRLASMNPVRRGMELTTSISMRSGIPRLLSVYQPTKTDGQAADVLHAVIVRGDITTLEQVK